MVCFTSILKAKGHAEKLWKVYDAVPVAVHLIDHVLVLFIFSVWLGLQPPFIDILISYLMLMFYVFFKLLTIC